MPKLMYTAEIVDAIAQRLATGEPLAAICRDDGMPDDDTVRNWMERADVGADVSRVIARARESGEDALAAECLSIADDARNDWIARRAAKGDERAEQAQQNGEVVQRSKLRIETRLKLLAKWNPKKWGDKVQQEHTGANGSNLFAGINVTFSRPD